MSDQNLDRLRELAQKLTDRETELERERKMLRAIYDTAISALIVMDDKGIIREWSPMAIEIFGYTQEEAIGQELASLIIPERFRDEHRNGLEQFRQTQEGPMIGKMMIVSAINKSEDEFPVELMIKNLDLDEDEKLFIGFVRSVKEREQLRADTLLFEHLMEEIGQDLDTNKDVIDKASMFLEEAKDRIERNLSRLRTLKSELE